MIKRPLGIVALLYAGGLLLGHFFQPPLPCLFAVSLALAAAALLLSRFRAFLLWPLIVFTGWTSFVFHTAEISPANLLAQFANKPVLASVRGILHTTPTERIYEGDEGVSFRTTARLDVTAVQSGTNWVPASGRVMVISSNELPNEFFEGQHVEIGGVLGPPSGPSAEGLFDFRNFLSEQGIYLQLKSLLADWKILGDANLGPPMGDRFKQWASSALALGHTNEDESLHLEQALTLGEKKYLSPKVAEPFVQASTYHIFAVDGLRMAIISGIFFEFLRLLRVPRLARGLTLIPIIWIYVGLTGWPASAIRAAVMLTIVIGGWTLRRPADVLNSLFAAALVILIYDPQQLFQAGFQLSFVVVFYILLIMPLFKRVIQWLLKTDPLLPDELRPRWQRWLHIVIRWSLGLAFSSLAAWLASIPLAAYYFHIFTPVSTPANIVAVPLCALVLIANISSLALAGWFPAGAEFVNHIGWHLMEWIRVTSEWFAHWPHAYAYVATPTLFSIFVYYAILLAIFTGWLFKRDHRTWRIAGIALIITVWCGTWLHQRTATRITVLPLNGGSACYGDVPGHKNDFLIDCGNEDSVDFVMEPYLRAQGVNSLPTLALTLGEAQQVGGFQKLQGLMPIEKIITSPVRFRSPEYRDILKLLDATPKRRQIVSSGDTFANWTVLYPTSTNHFAHADDNALVLRGEFSGVQILFLSDLGREGQSSLLECNSDLHADIVVAGLPQQSEPLSNGLLDSIHPKLIIIADSEMPSERRASKGLKQRLDTRGIPVIYTRTVGAVKITIRSGTWQATSADGKILATSHSTVR